MLFIDEFFPRVEECSHNFALPTDIAYVIVARFKKSSVELSEIDEFRPFNIAEWYDFFDEGGHWEHLSLIEHLLMELILGVCISRVLPLWESLENASEVIDGGVEEISNDWNETS